MSWDMRYFLSTSGLWPPSSIFLHTRTSDSLPTSLSVLPDPENVGIAVGIAFLSCIRAKTYVISYLLPVYVRHLWFPTYTDVERPSHQSLRVARSRKQRCSRWNCFAILYTSWDMRYFLSTSGLWPPSLISDMLRRRIVFPLVFLCCPTAKTCVKPLEFRCYYD